jgi:hypothetical protein
MSYSLRKCNPSQPFQYPASARESSVLSAAIFSWLSFRAAYGQPQETLADICVSEIKTEI